jgi:tRNA(Arg) A34 adenosine deaminase TadA
MMIERDNDKPPSDSHDYYMGLALVEAKNARAESEVPVGAILVGREGEILGRGHNSPIAMCDPTAHAEIMAIRRGAALLGNYRLPGARLYVTLEPCAMCVGAMLHARIGVLIFGAPEPKGGAAGSVVDLTRVPEFNHTIEVVGGIRSEECTELLRDFFRDRRRDKKKEL